MCLGFTSRMWIFTASLLTLSQQVVGTDEFIDIGLIFPVVESDFSLHPEGRILGAAMLMAFDEINDKNDGVADDLLPGINLRVTYDSAWGSLFSSGASAALNIMSDCNTHGNGVKVILGPDSLEGVMGGSPVLADYDVALVSYRSRSSLLGKSSTYPNLLRAVPGYFGDSFAIGVSMVAFFGWNKVTVIYQINDLDSYGFQSQLVFIKLSADLGIDVLSVHTVYNAMSDFDLDTVLNEVDAAGARIFIFFTEAELGLHVLRTGKAKKLFGEGTQVIGGEHMSFDEEYANLGLVDGNVSDLLAGFIGVKFSVEVPETPEVNAYYDRWYSRPATTGHIFPNGTAKCNDEMDYYGLEYLNQFYPHENRSATPICTGINTSDYSLRDLDYSIYAYDAVYSIARSLHELVNTGLSANEITSSMVHQKMLRDFSFTGLTGSYSYSVDTEQFDFDVGGRNGHVFYNFVNYVKSDDPNSKVHLVKKYGWSIDEWFDFSCAEVNPDCIDFKYNTVDNSRPYQSALPVLVDKPEIYSTILIIIGSISLLQSVIYVATIFSFSHRKIVKVTQPQLSYVMLFGAILIGIRVIIEARPLTGASCSVISWFSHLGFAFIFLILILKMWRVYLVSQMTRRVVTIRHVFALFSILIAIFIGLLAALNADGQTVKHVVITENQEEYTLERACSVKRPEFEDALDLIELVVLFVGIVFCYLTKDVSSYLSDTTSIVQAILSTLVIFIIVACLVFGVDLGADDRQFIIAMGLAIGSIRVQWVLFNALAVKLFLGYDLNNSLQEKIMAWSIFDVSFLQVLGKSNVKYNDKTNKDADDAILAKFRNLKEVGEIDKEIHNARAEWDKFKLIIGVLENVKYALLTGAQSANESRDGRYSVNNNSVAPVPSNAGGLAPSGAGGSINKNLSTADSVTRPGANRVEIVDYDKAEV